MLRSLEHDGLEVLPLGPVALHPNPLELGRARLRHAMRRGSFKHGHGLAFSHEWGKEFSTRIRASRPDIVFAPAAAPEVAFVQCDAPVVYLSDAVWSQIVDRYPNFIGLSHRSRRHGELIDRTAVMGAAAAVYPSRWAADAAITEYGVDSARVHVVPFGANLVPDRPPDRSRDGRVRLLFVATDWHRKGGDVALGASRALRASGIDAELVVCGCQPHELREDDRVTVVPFLDRNDLTDSRRLAELFEQASVFVLPTRADCFPIVVCEAAAFGLPVVASDAGGLPEAVVDQQTGVLLPVGAGVEAYTEAIRHMVAPGDTYSTMARASRERYEGVLNWAAWARSMRALFEAVL
jgi:glycosyltransferase involved in cell wall biosynthesis